MRVQMRAMAVFGFLNFCTGVLPGRLFQTATSLSAGQAAANSASSCWLAKDWAPAATAAAAWSGVWQAVMLLSASMVNVFIGNLLLRWMTAITTSIALVAHGCKRILQVPGDGRLEERRVGKECRS